MRRLLSTLLLCVSLFPAALSAQEGPGPDGEGMDAARAAFLE